MIAGAELLPVINPVSTNPANETAKKLTGRDYISWSAISTFRTCPLKYRFRYIDGLPEEVWVSVVLCFFVEHHDPVPGADKDERAGHRGACAGGEPKGNQPHDPGCKRSLAGSSNGRVLSGSEHDGLLKLWLSAGL